MAIITPSLKDWFVSVQRHANLKHILFKFTEIEFSLMSIDHAQGGREEEEGGGDLYELEQTQQVTAANQI